jgi:serine/threonine protein kinase
MENVPDLILLQQTLNEVENLSFLAQGGFKAVYKGTVQGRTEAIKVVFIPPADIDSEEERSEIIGRVRREIEALNKCLSPHIVRLGSLLPQLIQIDGRDYLIYSEEFLEGDNLRSKLKQAYKPNFRELKQLATSLFEAIQVLKAQDLIHRDIKPDNIIALQDQARPFVILDLGIAFKLHGSALTRNPMYRPGTLPYMAPEMFNPRFRETLDFRSDLYSAGVTLYEYASGTHPIVKRGEDDYTTMYRILNTTPVSLASHRSDLPKDFCITVDQLIKKLPALRPSAIQTLLKKLEVIS